MYLPSQSFGLWLPVGLAPVPLSQGLAEGANIVVEYNTPERVTSTSINGLTTHSYSRDALGKITISFQQNSFTAKALRLIQHAQEAAALGGDISKIAQGPLSISGPGETGELCMLTDAVLTTAPNVEFDATPGTVVFVWAGALSITVVQ